MTRHAVAGSPPASSPIATDYRLRPRPAPSLVWRVPGGTRIRDRPSRNGIIERCSRASGGREPPLRAEPSTIAQVLPDTPTTRNAGSGESPPTAVTAAAGAGTSGDLILDRYRLDHPIGRGGHGTVWEAVDERLERRVAVKVIRYDGAGTGRRAEREGRASARLVHPGIVTLYEVAADQEAVYLVSELVRGRTMAELAAAGGLSDRDVCGIGIALCSALEHAHSKGIVHRDVKPQNVIVVAEPAAGAGFAKLTDFGVAHVGGEDSLTRTGDVVGTLAYMAPEQAEGERPSPAADVYSLALVLYEGWTGSGPAGVVSARLAGRAPTPLGRLRPDLPAGLCRVVDGSLEPRRELRPSLRELDAELRATVDELSDEGGLEEPATRRRLGIPSARPARPLATVPGWLWRAGAGIAAGALVTAALELLGAGPPSVSPLAAGAVAAAIVALLPRLGWLLAAAAVLGWLTAAEQREGTALLVAAALAPTPLLLPRAGGLWSVPALAPLLGTVGLAPAFCAVAALAPTTPRRAGLAVAGLVWLVAAEVLTGEVLLVGPADGTPAPRAWQESVTGAGRDAIYPALESLMLVTAAVWAVLAAVIGLALRGRSLALDLPAVIVWAIALVAAHAWLADLLAGSIAASEARGAAAGAILGAAAALGVSASRARGRRLEQPYFP